MATTLITKNRTAQKGEIRLKPCFNNSFFDKYVAILAQGIDIVSSQLEREGSVVITGLSLIIILIAQCGRILEFH